MNFNYSEIEKIMEKVKDCIEYYEGKYINNKIFTMYLSDGERIQYEITPNNLAHLLGFRLDLVKTTYNFCGNNSYEILKEISENPFKLYNLFAQNIVKQEQIFSKHILQKLEGFKNNIKADVAEIIEETEFVCNFKKEENWGLNGKNQKYDYIIVKKYKDNKVALLCLVKNENIYYAMSNQLFNSIDEAKTMLNELLPRQEITILSGLNVYSRITASNYTSNLNLGKKMQKINELKYYKKNFKCNIEICSDYQYTIGKLNKNKAEKIYNSSTADSIINAITNGRLIENQEFYDSDLKGIIDSWNDYISNSTTTTNKNVQISYTNAVNELKNFKKLVELLTKENDSLKNEVRTLIIENEILKQDNSVLEEIIKEIHQIIKPRTK